MDIIQYLVQGGAVGIALYLAFIVNQQNKNQTDMNKLLTGTLTKIAEDHRQTIERNTDAWKQNTEALAKLNERIK
jgi:uncharacterized protein HemX